MADAPPPPSPSPHDNLWRKTPAAHPPGTRRAEGSGKRKQAFYVLAVLLALVGATAAWLYFLSPVPMPSFLGGWIDQYKEPIPVNAWAPEDREALGKKPRWERINAFPTQVRSLLKQVLEKLR